MSSKRKTAIVVCPGRGSYQHTELGYLQKYHADKPEFMGTIDDYRKNGGQVEISKLDNANRFDSTSHTRSDNASSLIYACAYADYLSIDQSKYEIVGITGNSMGWYIALACANALNTENALHLIDTMGTIMLEQAGAQLIYPMLDDNWQAIPGRRAQIKALQLKLSQIEGCTVYDSIYLGGYQLFSGNEKAIQALMSQLPKHQGYPMRLTNHAAFHSPLMRNASNEARTKLDAALFNQADCPLIDGRGKIWSPYASNLSALWDYTLGHQITETYDFSSAIQTSMQEFAPDVLIILGPGNTLGAATAHALLEIKWQGLQSKQAFVSRQQDNPIILSLGLTSQRQLVSA